MYFFLLDQRILDRGYRTYWERLIPEIRERGLLGERKEVSQDSDVVLELNKLSKQKKFQTVVAVGSDDFLSTVGAALIGTSLALGYIPLGESSCFAERFHISSQPGQVGDHLAARRVRDFNLLKVGREYAIDYFKIGLAALPRAKTVSPYRRLTRLLDKLPGSSAHKKIKAAEFDLIVETADIHARITSCGVSILINQDRTTPSSPPSGESFSLISYAPVPGADYLIDWDDSTIRSPSATLLRLTSATLYFARSVPACLDCSPIELPEQIQVQLLPRCLRLII